MAILHGIFGGLRDGKQGAFSQLDGSNPLEQLLQQLTGSQPQQPASQQPTAQPAGAQPQQTITGMLGSMAPARKANVLDYVLKGPNAGQIVQQEEAMRALAERDPEAAMILRTAGPGGLSAYLNDKRDQGKPSLYTTRDGIVAVSPKDGGGYTTETVFEASPAPRDAPSGWQWSGEKLEPIPNGPADPAYIARVSGVRRDAVTARPMPRAGGGGRGGASIPPPPSGWRPR